MVTKEFVLAFAAERHIKTAETLYWVWEATNDAIPPPPAGYESWTLEQMAQWIAENYTGAQPTP